MTFLLVITLGLLFVYALYFAAQTARIGSNPRDFLDGGMRLPGWSVMFILPAIGVAALGFERHLLLVSRYGLQASHVAVGLITVAVAAVMFWNRLWVATRLAGCGYHFFSCAKACAALDFAPAAAVPLPAKVTCAVGSTAL